MYTPNNLNLDFIVNSLSAGALNPGHQSPYLKSLIARPNCPWKNIDTAYIEAKRNLYKLFGQKRVNCTLFVHPYINVVTDLRLLIKFASNKNPTTTQLIFKHASSFSDYLPTKFVDRGCVPNYSLRDTVCKLAVPFPGTNYLFLLSILFLSFLP